MGKNRSAKGQIRHGDTEARSSAEGKKNYWCLSMASSPGEPNNRGGRGMRNSAMRSRHAQRHARAEQFSGSYRDGDRRDRRRRGTTRRAFGNGACCYCASAAC